MNRAAIEEILELPAEQRVAIAQQIWESVFAETQAAPLPAAHRAELDRRWEAFQRDPDEGEPWETIKKSLLDE